MCGITGFILKGEHVVERDQLLKNMATAIQHRGPDDEGFYSTQTSSGEYTVGLAHRRLSIIDLDSGHQPIGNEDDSIQIVFNGEIYNYQGLREELISQGHVFKTNSDTETIIHAYEEYGHACVEHFRGMFAFAIWDQNKQCMFIARDRYGKKPMYLYKKDNSILFSSEIKSILSYKSFNKTINYDAVWHYLSYRYVPSPLTLFKGVEKLLPGCCAEWKAGAFKQWSYFTPTDSHPISSAYQGKDPVGDFLKKLDEATKIRMVSDVPFGAFLSGGIDSSAIVGLMSKHSDSAIKTFSVGFSESKYSELGYAKTIADQFKTDHHELIVSQADLMDHLPALIRFRDAPVAEPSDIPIYLLSVEARKTVKMVLTGEGSDEMLGGYPKHVYERYVQCYQKIPEFMRSELFQPIINSLPYKFRRAKTAITNLGLTNWEERMARWFGALSSKEREQLLAFQSSDIPNQHIKPDDKNSALRNILYFDQMSWLPDNLLERGDRMTMAASLEARMPFMDHELVALVSSMPDEYRIKGSSTKWILREAMTHILSKQILNRPKVGFRVPVNEWFQGPMKEYLYDHLTGSSAITAAYYNKNRLEQVLSEHISGRQNHEKLLWAMLNLEIWHKEYDMTV
jgi:asparagine synthase (glutamine-hydrolysing)